MANCYLVSYDLRKVRDYRSLNEAINTYSVKAKILESFWAIVTTKTAVQLRDHLRQHIDGDDGLFVCLSGKEAAWVGISTSEWLKKNI